MEDDSELPACVVVIGESLGIIVYKEVLVLSSQNPCSDRPSPVNFNRPLLRDNFLCKNFNLQKLRCSVKSR